MADTALLKDVFNLIDEDGGGAVSGEEVLKFTSYFPNPPTHGQVEGMVAKVDADGSGEVDAEEFAEIIQGLVQVCGMPVSAMIEHYTHHVFEELWTTVAGDDGSMSRNEMRELVEALGTGHSSIELTKLFDKYDQDGSGELDESEFVGIITEISKGRSLSQMVHRFHEQRRLQRERLAQRRAMFGGGADKEVELEKRGRKKKDKAEPANDEELTRLKRECSSLRAQLKAAEGQPAPVAPRPSTHSFACGPMTRESTREQTAPRAASREGSGGELRRAQSELRRERDRAAAAEKALKDAEAARAAAAQRAAELERRKSSGAAPLDAAAAAELERLRKELRQRDAELALERAAMDRAKKRQAGMEVELKQLRAAAGKDAGPCPHCGRMREELERAKKELRRAAARAGAEKVVPPHMQQDKELADLRREMEVLRVQAADGVRMSQRVSGMQAALLHERTERARVEEKLARALDAVLAAGEAASTADQKERRARHHDAHRASASPQWHSPPAHGRACRHGCVGCPGVAAGDGSLHSQSSYRAGTVPSPRRAGVSPSRPEQGRII